LVNRTADGCVTSCSKLWCESTTHQLLTETHIGVACTSCSRTSIVEHEPAGSLQPVVVIMSQVLPCVFDLCVPHVTSFTIFVIWGCMFVFLHVSWFTICDVFDLVAVSGHRFKQVRMLYALTCDHVSHDVCLISLLLHVWIVRFIMSLVGPGSFADLWIVTCHQSADLWVVIYHITCAAVVWWCVLACHRSNRFQFWLLTVNLSQSTAGTPGSIFHRLSTCGLPVRKFTTDWWLRAVGLHAPLFCWSGVTIVMR
jgi:hypothetical protein